MYPQCISARPISTCNQINECQSLYVHLIDAACDEDDNNDDSEFIEPNSVSFYSARIPLWH